MPNTIRLIIDTSELESFSTSLGEALAKLQEGRTVFPAYAGIDLGGHIMGTLNDVMADAR